MTHHAACRIIVIGMQLAYYGAAAIKIRDYTFKDTHGRATYTPVPDWGWILETVAGVLWLIIAAISACTLLPFPCALSDAHDTTALAANSAWALLLPRCSTLYA